jgi:hypothetical protein
MSFCALSLHISRLNLNRIETHDIINWIVENTDFKTISIFPVKVRRGSFWGCFKQIELPGRGMYSAEPEIVVKILVDESLDERWQRLVIAKELSHVFDGAESKVNTPQKLRQLLNGLLIERGGIVTNEFADWDTYGLWRALPLLFPRQKRLEMAQLHQQGLKTFADIAHEVAIPTEFVQIWLDNGEKIEDMLCPPN